MDMVLRDASNAIMIVNKKLGFDVLGSSMFKFKSDLNPIVNW